MVIVIVGESASGKTTLAKIIEEKQQNYSKIVTYTTRPMRQGESEGIDYHYISDDEFDKLKNSNFFVEYAGYRNWQYGTSANFKSNEDKVVVLTPAGARAMKKYAIKHPDINVVTVYLCVDRRSRLIKSLVRGDDIDEAYRRNLSDVGQFDAFEREADITIHNENFNMSREAVYDNLIGLLTVLNNTKSNI